MLNILQAYLLASWHLRRMPKGSDAERLARAVWCRDHCGTFAGRWVVIAVAAVLIQFSPFGGLLLVGGWPVLLLVFLIAFCLGIGHLVAQIVAQKRAGPPRIDPPEDWGGGD
jgi:hypothetical protein